ncbi:MAG: DUF1573 domain-containing protein [Planctomycetaceae bacterium]|jgi:hypothetical protein|nr:DUF1573 domain-containing protein [Planctomycetaceae bacterium]MBT6155374.1 DUF1573 domain-containing protein [Planctomycetaceae bacterium]MBT6487292.1 DUF1573 domain-containing protein [Planctomycetaceae bacterium]MBT6493689.1 DUF1573 domain-containing protein [Planctomycetaceae bacterium]
MESHPLTKVVVGIVGLGIVAVAVWFGRSGGNMPVGSPGNRLATDTPDDIIAKEVFDRPPISPEGPYPEVKLDKEKYDFSMMAVGGNGSHSFVIHNVGQAALLLKKGKTTCKCTISDLAAGEIPPGGSASIDLTWKALAVDPQFEQRAIIYTNDPDNDEFELVISGKITEVIEVNPRGAWTLNELSVNSESTVSGSIFSHILESFEIDETQLSSDSFEVSVEPMAAERLKALDAKSGYSVNVSVTPNVPIGVFREKLTFKLKTPDIDPIEVYVEGRRTGPITFLAARRTRWNASLMAINLGEFDAKQGASGSLLLFVRGLEDEELEFTSVKSDPADLQVELKPDPTFQGGGRKKYELQIKVPPGRRSETRPVSQPAEVEIKTNHPEAGTLKFRIKYISR